MIAPALVDPRDLTPQQRKAVVMLGDGWKLIRVTRGWGHAPHHVTLTIAAQLKGRHLVRIDTSGAHHRLVLTSAGESTYAVLQERQRRRA